MISLSARGGHISAASAWTMLIKNPTDDEYREVISASEQAVWPYMPRIKARCRIETVLEKCTRKIRERIAAKVREESDVPFDPTRDGKSYALREADSAAVAGSSINRTPSFHTSRKCWHPYDMAIIFTHAHTGIDKH